MSTSATSTLKEYNNGPIICDFDINIDSNNLLHIILGKRDKHITPNINDSIIATNFQYIKSKDPYGINYEPEIDTQYSLIDTGTNKDYSPINSIPLISSLIINNKLYFFWLSKIQSGESILYYINCKILDISVPISNTPSPWSNVFTFKLLESPVFQQAQNNTPFGYSIKTIQYNNTQIIVSYIINSSYQNNHNNQKASQFGSCLCKINSTNTSNVSFLSNVILLENNLNYVPEVPDTTGIYNYSDNLLLLKKPSGNIKVIIPYSHSGVFVIGSTDNSKYLHFTTDILIGDINIAGDTLSISLSWNDAHKIDNLGSILTNIKNTYTINGYYVDDTRFNISIGVNAFNNDITSNNLLWFLQLQDNFSGGNTPYKVLHHQSFDTSSIPVNKLVMSKSYSGIPIIFYGTDEKLLSVTTDRDNIWQTPITYDVSINKIVLSKMNNFFTFKTSRYNNQDIHNVITSYVSPDNTQNYSKVTNLVAADISLNEVFNLVAVDFTSLGYVRVSFNHLGYYTNFLLQGINNTNSSVLFSNTITNFNTDIDIPIANFGGNPLSSSSIRVRTNFLTFTSDFISTNIITTNVPVLTGITLEDSSYFNLAYTIANPGDVKSLQIYRYTSTGTPPPNTSSYSFIKHNPDLTSPNNTYSENYPIQDNRSYWFLIKVEYGHNSYSPFSNDISANTTTLLPDPSMNLSFNSCSNTLTINPIPVDPSKCTLFDVSINTFNPNTISPFTIPISNLSFDISYNNYWKTSVLINQKYKNIITDNSFSLTINTPVSPFNIKAIYNINTDLIDITWDSLLGATTYDIYKVVLPVTFNQVKNNVITENDLANLTVSLLQTNVTSTHSVEKENKGINLFKLVANYPYGPSSISCNFGYATIFICEDIYGNAEQQAYKKKIFPQTNISFVNKWIRYNNRNINFNNSNT